MDNTQQTSITYKIKRKTPRARVYSIIGMAFFGIGFATLIVFLVPVLLGYNKTNSSFTDTFLIMCLLPAICIVVSIICWIASSVFSSGSLTIKNDKIEYKCSNERYDLIADQITLVQTNGNTIRITFSKRTLVLISPQSEEIADKVKAFVAANKTIETPKPTETSTINSGFISADEIRKYKELVEDGVITQEQFDDIIKKMG